MQVGSWPLAELGLQVVRSLLETGGLDPEYTLDRDEPPKLTPAREALLVDLHKTGQKSPSELAELFGVGRSTVYPALERAAGTMSAAGAAGATPAT